MWGHSPCVFGDEVGVGGIAGGGGVIIIPLEALAEGMAIGVDLARTMAIDMGDDIGIDISTSSLASTPEVEESLLVAAAMSRSYSDCVPRWPRCSASVVPVPVLSPAAKNLLPGTRCLFSCLYCLFIFA